MVVILAVVDYFDDLFIVVVAKVEVANFGSSCLFATFFHTATYFEREPPFSSVRILRSLCSQAVRFGENPKVALVSITLQLACVFVSRVKYLRMVGFCSAHGMLMFSS